MKIVIFFSVIYFFDIFLVNSFKLPFLEALVLLISAIHTKFNISFKIFVALINHEIIIRNKKNKNIIHHKKENREMLIK